MSTWQTEYMFTLWIHHLELILCTDKIKYLDSVCGLSSCNLHTGWKNPYLGQQNMLAFWSLENSVRAGNTWSFNSNHLGPFQEYKKILQEILQLNQSFAVIPKIRVLSGLCMVRTGILANFFLKYPLKMKEAAAEVQSLQVQENPVAQDKQRISHSLLLETLWFNCSLLAQQAADSTRRGCWYVSPSAFHLLQSKSTKKMALRKHVTICHSSFKLFTLRSFGCMISFCQYNLRVHITK